MLKNIILIILGMLIPVTASVLFATFAKKSTLINLFNRSIKEIEEDS